MNFSFVAAFKSPEQETMVSWPEHLALLNGLLLFDIFLPYDSSPFKIYQIIYCVQNVNIF